MSSEPVFVCPSCETSYPPAPRSPSELAGMGVVGLSCASGVGMLVLLGQGNTTWGGACAVSAMGLLGLGMWLQRRGRAPCPNCGHRA